uniref:protein-tyrosine-phosphatase n=1 Tax=Poecilia reticulata TaxID=8081 RepID=A0A3P9NHX2_POERE
MSSSLRSRAESEQPVSRQLLQTVSLFISLQTERRLLLLQEEDAPHNGLVPKRRGRATPAVRHPAVALPRSGARRDADSAMSSGASVLVHCAAGISRSPALAVAYIMYSLEMDLDHAYRFVKERRPSISPNFNFLGQLQHFQGILNQKASSCDMTRQQQENQQPSTKDRGTGLLRSQNRNHCVRAATEDSIIQTRKLLLDDSGNKRGLWTFDLTACQNQQCNQKPCDAPASSLCESREPLPKCRQLQFKSGCTSLLEKRKSLTLSLTPLGFCPPSLASSHPQSVTKASLVHSVPHPERSPHLGGCSRAEEKEQGLLSPSSITLNKLFNWGERVLLGLVHPVKMGQPALPYRC